MIWAAPVWWLLGLNLLIYHVAAAVLLIAMVASWNRENRPIFLDFPIFLILFFVFVYGFSLAVNAEDSPPSRVLASAYNLSYWVMGLCLIALLSNLFSREAIPDFLNALPPVGWVISLLFLVMLFLGAQGHIDFAVRTPLYGLKDILGNTPLVEQSVSAILLVFDWFYEVSRPRFNALSPYATATAALIMMIMIMTLTKAEYDKEKKPSFLILIALSFGAMFFTFSRTTLIAFIFGGAAVSILKRKEPFLWLLFFFVLFILSYPLFERATSWILGFRQGSTLARFELYRASLEQLKDTRWIFGLGVKPLVDDLNYPLGSHSTYVSLLFRTGILGASTILFFQIGLLWRWYRLKPYAQEQRETFILWSGLGWVFISMGFWLLTEDLDAPQFLAFMYFSFVGIFEGFRRELLRG